VVLNERAGGCYGGCSDAVDQIEAPLDTVEPIVEPRETRGRKIKNAASFAPA
jgi:hypothetical protein